MYHDMIRNEIEAKILLKIQENEEEEKEAAAKDFDSFTCYFCLFHLSFPWIQIKQQINRFNVIHSNAYRAFHFFSK